MYHVGVALMFLLGMPLATMLLLLSVLILGVLYVAPLFLVLVPFVFTVAVLELIFEIIVKYRYGDADLSLPGRVKILDVRRQAVKEMCHENINYGALYDMLRPWWQVLSSLVHLTALGYLYVFVSYATLKMLCGLNGGVPHLDYDGVPNEFVTRIPLIIQLWDEMARSTYSLRSLLKEVAKKRPPGLEVRFEGNPRSLWGFEEQVYLVIRPSS